MQNHKTQTIAISLVRPDPNNPRKTFDDIEPLAKNIKKQGLIHPIEVDKTYMVIVGERRYRATLLLGSKRIRVSINEEDLTPYQRLVRQMSENLHQSAAKNGDAMNPLDTAQAWAKLYELKTGQRLRSEEYDYSNYGQGLIQMRGSMEEIITEVGAEKRTVWRLLQILNEPQFVQKAIRENKVPYSYVEAVGRAPRNVQNSLREKMIRGDYQSSRELREDIQVSQKLPELAQIIRDRTIESTRVNRVFNGISRLGLALDAIPLHTINTQEQEIVKKQLLWIQNMIDMYLMEELTTEKA